MPEELTFLPHVESSFNYKAYSKVGAAGIWQFMRRTARLYRMKVGYTIDERRDPIIATKAAAKFLRDNYARLKAWPLAITAYNHGPVSLERAVKKLGTRNISEIIDKYEGRRFGFASKNFYATFMATVEISRAPDFYFGDFEKAEPIEFSVIKLHDRLSIRQITRTLGFTRKQIRELNPSIRSVVFRSNLSLPRGYRLKIPKLKWERLQQYRKVLAELKPAKRIIKSGGEHVVSPGESLYVIARIYEVPMSDLIVLNQISNPSRVFPGMKVKIPGRKVAKKKNPQPAVPKAVTIATAAPVTTPPAGKKGDEIQVVAESAPQPEKKGLLSRIKSFFVKDEARTSGLVQRVDEKDLSKIESDVVVSSKKPTKNFVFDSESYELDTLPQPDGTYLVTIEAEETLGHFAEWAGIRASDIRKSNYLNFNDPIAIGQKLKIPIADEKALMQFNLNRIQFHQAIEEDLYSNYDVAGTVDYRVKSGDTVNEILQKYEVPFWLMRKYQLGPDFKNLKVGQTLKIPQLTPVSQ